MLPSFRWQWPSTKPGISTLSAKRSSSVYAPQAETRSRSPTARMRPSRTATCVASGLHRVHRDDLAGGVDSDRAHGFGGWRRVHGRKDAKERREGFGLLCVRKAYAAGNASGGTGTPSTLATRRHATQCPGAALAQGLGFGHAGRLGDRAACGEAAARRRIDRARRIAAQLDALGRTPASAGHRRHGRHQRDAVRMQRPREEGPARRAFDDLPEVHHRDVVADVLDHGHVVRDEEIGQAELALQACEQVQDLRADRDVEGRHRLVADDQLRIRRERTRDVDALALSARELVREELLLLGPEADGGEQLGDACRALGRRADLHQVERRTHRGAGTFARG